LEEEKVCFTLNARYAVGVYLFQVKEIKILLRIEETSISYALIAVKR
jgi:hypothetical protein